MDVIIIDKKEYYETELIKKISPIYFKGCRNVREVIKKKQIESKNYTFGTWNDNEWIGTDGLSKKMDKLLLSVEWVKNNIPELAEDEDIKHDIMMAPVIITIHF